MSIRYDITLEDNNSYDYFEYINQRVGTVVEFEGGNYTEECIACWST